jgi:hypothetical protein
LLDPVCCWGFQLSFLFDLLSFSFTEFWFVFRISLSLLNFSFISCITFLTSVSCLFSLNSSRCLCPL